MAERRMFSKKITDSDAFIEMSPSSQALYFHLNQGADDDGFNNQIQNAMFKAHASIDDLKVLLTKNFIIRFEIGVVVIKHWWMHNTLRKDRYTPTNFQEELKMLGLKDNNSYTLDDTVDKRLPFGCQMVSTDKNREDKNSIDKNSKEEDKEKTYKKEKFKVPSLEEVKEYCKERNNNVDAQYFIDYYTSKGWLVGMSPMKDWKASVRLWERQDRGEVKRRLPDDVTQEDLDYYDSLTR